MWCKYFQLSKEYEYLDLSAHQLLSLTSRPLSDTYLHLVDMRTLSEQILRDLSGLNFEETSGQLNTATLNRQIYSFRFTVVILSLLVIQHAHRFLRLTCPFNQEAF